MVQAMQAVNRGAIKEDLKQIRVSVLEEVQLKAIRSRVAELRIKTDIMMAQMRETIEEIEEVALIIRQGIKTTRTITVEVQEMVYQLTKTIVTSRSPGQIMALHSLTCLLKHTTRLKEHPRLDLRLLTSQK